MKTELRLHGQISATVEYTATAAGCRFAHHHFYAVEDQSVRFFSPGNELILTSDGVTCRGAGGSLCQYMFGDNRPAADLTRPGVVNRLTLIGAHSDPAGQLLLNDHNQSIISYDELFTQGHAVNNYFLFVDGLTGKTVLERRKQLLQRLGKTLKRLPEPGQLDDSRLAAAILSRLPADCTLYLIRLTHTRNRHFQQELAGLYYRNRILDDARMKALATLAESLGLTYAQQQRIRLDVYYRHRDNYRIADAYHKLLMTCSTQGNSTANQRRQMTRLKTLAVRQQVPDILLPALDRMYAPTLPQFGPEADDLDQARRIFQRLQYGGSVGNGEIAELLTARQQARKNHDYRFEQLVHNIRQTLEMRLRSGSSAASLGQLSTVCQLLDAFDTTQAAIHRIVFLDNHLPTSDVVAFLIEKHQQFEQTGKGLFEKLFIDDISRNSYLGNFGRRKLACLQQGLDKIAGQQYRPQDLYDGLVQIADEEQQYRSTLSAAKDWLDTNHAGISTERELERLYTALSRLVQTKGPFSIPLNRRLFQSIVHDLKKEHFYLKQFLPVIISDNDQRLREDFFANSGLDFFHIEELEQRYVTDNSIDPDVLQRLQCNI